MRKFFTILPLIFSLLIPAKLAQAETILSKQDAAAMFSLSFQEWKQNVLVASTRLSHLIKTSSIA